ncbi:MAG TPA: IS1595 family transposase, partial [Acidimicrobiales bacterium]|nr:IS1595 family transposase [Acidimicrobiales bacterium]
MEFQARYPDDDACLEFLWRTRFAPDGEHAVCPKEGVERVFRKYQMVNRNTSWTCTGCGHHVHPTAGTIFHKSSTSLHLWFYAMYIMASTRCGISAKQLERELGVTYKTAWRMFNLIRNQLMTQDETTTLGGKVEADETYHGGRRKGRTGRPGAGDRQKTPVFGMVERKGHGGRVVALTVDNVKATTLLPHMRKRILPASVVFTDEYQSYAQLSRNGYTHQRINHSEGVYVSGDVHTNTIEGFWSLVKRGISGTHHAVSAKWLQGYLNEYAWRYNHRRDP